MNIYSLQQTSGQANRFVRNAESARNTLDFQFNKAPAPNGLDTTRHCFLAQSVRIACLNLQQALPREVVKRTNGVSNEP